MNQCIDILKYLHMISYKRFSNYLVIIKILIKNFYIVFQINFADKTFHSHLIKRFEINQNFLTKVILTYNFIYRIALFTK